MTSESSNCVGQGICGGAAQIALAALLSLLCTAAPADDVVLSCLHDQPPEAALLTHALQPWADEVAVESGGTLRIAWKASSGAELWRAFDVGEAPCLLAPPEPGKWDAALLGLPFIAPPSSERASRGGWDAMASGILPLDPTLQPLAVVVEAPLPLLAIGAAPPMPQAMSGATVAVPNAPSGVPLEALGVRVQVTPPAEAARRLSSGAVDFAVLPRALAPPGLVEVALDTDRALAGRPLVLGVARAWLEVLTPAQRASLMAGNPRRLSARAGRALDRAEDVARASAPSGSVLWPEAQMTRLRDAGAAAQRNAAAALPDGRARLSALRAALDEAEAR